jgi:SprT protein
MTALPLRTRTSYPHGLTVTLIDVAPSIVFSSTCCQHFFWYKRCYGVDEVFVNGRLRTVDECKAAAAWRVQSLCDEHGIIRPKITYGLRGTDAGQAFMEQNRLDLNLVLFRENFEDAIVNTIPHEVAHVEAWRRGLTRGNFHAGIWKQLMIQFRAAPIACHNLDVTTASSRTGYFTYRCLCNSGNMVSLETHHQIQAAPELFRCRHCKQLPQFIPS